MESQIYNLAVKLTEALRNRKSKTSFDCDFTVDSNLLSKADYEKKALNDLLCELQNYLEK